MCFYYHLFIYWSQNYIRKFISLNLTWVKHLPFILLIPFLLDSLGNLAPKATINSSEMPLLCPLVVSFKEEGLAVHSTILAWRIPSTEDPGKLQSIESHSQTQLKQLSTWCHCCPHLLNAFTTWWSAGWARSPSFLLVASPKINVEWGARLPITLARSLRKPTRQYSAVLER